MPVDVTVWTNATDEAALHLSGDAVSFVNDASYGPAKNFNILSDDSPDGEKEVVLVNLANIVAAEVTVIE